MESLFLTMSCETSIGWHLGVFTSNMIKNIQIDACSIKLQLDGILAQMNTLCILAGSGVLPCECASGAEACDVLSASSVQ